MPSFPDRLPSRLLAALTVTVWYCGLVDIRAAPPPATNANLRHADQARFDDRSPGPGPLQSAGASPPRSKGAKGLMIVDTGASLTLLNDVKYGSLLPWT